MRGALCGSALVVAIGSFALAGAPAARREPVIDEYHGVKVADDYRWLEDAASPEVKAWVEAQNAASRAFLDAIPSRTAVRDRLKSLDASVGTSYKDLAFAAGRILAIKTEPPREQPLLVALLSPDAPGSERVIVDPNALAGKATHSIDWFVPSPDGKLVAVAISEGGSEDASLRIFETEGGRQRPDVVPRVNYPTAGGSVAWKADRSGVYYTHYPQGDERPAEDRHFYQQVYFHKLGTPAASDAYVFGKDLPRIAEIRLEASPDGQRLLASVQNGDGGAFAHYLMGADGAWSQLTRFEDGVVAATFGHAGSLYLVSRKGAPRGRVLRMPTAPGAALDQAAELLSEGEGSIEPPLLVTKTRVYVARINGGPSQVEWYDVHGRAAGRLPLPAVGAVEEMVGLAGDEAMFRVETYTEPSAWQQLDAAGKVRATALSSRARVSFADAEVTRETAVSKDGTRVPLSIIHRKGLALDGSHPALLTGYGGYSISKRPAFLGPKGRVWLDQGGVWVVANLRGGGEFGDEWHRAGNLTRKQNVFDDFAACARHLAERGYTSASKLGIEGGSNGGLLMGAVLTQHPELLGAVVSHVGIYDMLRVELDPNGAFNVTEFGSVKDKELFDALYAYSPYHHVRDGASCPPVLMLTGDNDGRVNPMQSRKMTARLQAANPSGTVLLRTSASSGHGHGTAASEGIEQAADVFAFLFAQLGIAYR
jgi:prolyl oligopeptidase